MTRLKDLKDLRSIDQLKDIKLDELFDEIRGIAGKRAGELLDEGRTRTRHAVGAPGGGAVFAMFAFGLFLGALAGAAVALLAAPVPGVEARRRLGQSVEKVRSQAAEWQGAGGDGRTTYASPYAEPAKGEPSYARPSTGIPAGERPLDEG